MICVNCGATSNPYPLLLGSEYHFTYPAGLPHCALICGNFFRPSGDSKSDYVMVLESLSFSAI